MDFKKDYYGILEIASSASKQEIKAAYRRLAKMYHPDKNPGDASSEEKFKLVLEAYDAAYL
jgi:molecular chaperone DnaJ